MINFGVQMPAWASLRHRLLADVLNDRGKDGKLVGDDAFADDELRAAPIASATPLRWLTNAGLTT
jgi:hypothetical protein